MDHDVMSESSVWSEGEGRDGKCLGLGFPTRLIIQLEIVGRGRCTFP